MTGLLRRWRRRYWLADQAALARVARGAPAMVVTGASAGIGEAIAMEFAAAGRRLVLVARHEAPLRRVADAIVERGGAAPLVVALDVTSQDAVVRLNEALSGAGLYLDVLVNCAGVGHAGAFDEAEQGRLEALLALNVAALTRLMRAALPDMLVRGEGGIINIASLGGFVPGPQQAAYYASKSYVISLSEAVAHETRGMGVRVVAVAPGPVDTGFHDAMAAHGSLYRHVGMMMQPSAVARSVKRGYDLGLTVIVPGVIPKAVAVMVRVLPHWVTVPIVALLLRPRGKPGDAERHTG